MNISSRMEAVKALQPQKKKKKNSIDDNLKS